MSTDPLPAGVAAIGRDFHRYPELGFTEFRTASRLAAALHTAGWDLRTGADAIAAASRLGVPEQAELAAASRRAVETGGVDRYARGMAGGLTAVGADLSGRRPGPTIAIRFDIDALPITEAAEATRAAMVGNYRSEFDGVMHARGHDGHARRAPVARAQWWPRGS